ncbi:MAG: hypothetical protein K8I02_04800, partial [Candidatus Methylomirabilis sp.]|nr:hypothetical protein [Deltaproteobacteria bacterium]
VHAILAEKEAAVKELEAIPALLPFPHPCWFEKELRTPTLAAVKDHPRYAQVAERSKDWRRKPSR